MYNIVFYREANGHEPVKDYILSLFAHNDKDSRIKREKIQDYMNILKEHGTRAGKPFVKHIEGDIWELRPLRDRFMFFTYVGNTIVLLSHFRKTTDKTPKREIAKAKKYMKDYKERVVDFEKGKG